MREPMCMRSVPAWAHEFRHRSDVLLICMNAPKASPADERAGCGGDVVLVVDDDPYMRLFLSRGLEQWFGKVQEASGLVEAKTLLALGEHFTAVVCDYHLRDGRGSDLYQWMRERKLSTPFLLISGDIFSKLNEAEFRFLKKPFALKDLLDALSDLIQSGRDIRRQ